jgi:hypothetical protein
MLFAITTGVNNDKLTTSTTTAISYCDRITKLIGECYNEIDMNNKVQILYEINSLLPKRRRINIPSLITDDYIDAVLYRIEEDRRSN